MKAVVTGANGFVGPHLVRHLEDLGDEVIPFGKGTGPDLRDHSEWRSTIGELKPDVIYHLAGWSNVGTSWDSPARCYQLNTQGTVNVLDAARVHEISKVVLVSSADLYEGTTDGPISESHPLDANNPYAASKLACEIAANQFFTGYGLPVVVARPFNHIGPGQAEGFVASDFASQIVAIENGNLDCVLHGNLDAQRDFTDVRDVVSAYRLLATHGSDGEIYNICSQTPTQISSILNYLTEASTHDIKTQLDESRFRPVDCLVRYGSSEKLKKTTGWKPAISLEQTMSDLLSDMRSRTR